MAGEFLDEDRQYEISAGLHDRGFLRFGNFNLKDGSWSPYYINLRGIGSFNRTSSLSDHKQAAIRDDVVRAYSDMVKVFDSDHIMGIPEAALTLAGLVGRESVRSVLQRRIKQKYHGEPVAVEGDYKPGETVTLLDDVVTSGKSKFEEAEAVNRAGLGVDGFVVLVDREQGGVQEIEDSGGSIIVGMKISSIVNILREAGRLPKYEAQIINAYTAGEITERPE